MKKNKVGGWNRMNKRWKAEDEIQKQTQSEISRGRGERKPILSAVSPTFCLFFLHPLILHLSHPSSPHIQCYFLPAMLLLYFHLLPLIIHCVGCLGGNGADCGVTQVSGTQTAEKQKSHPGTSSWFCLCSPYFSTDFDSLFSIAPFLLHIDHPLQFFSALFKLHSPTFNHPITPPLYIYLFLLFSPPQHLSCMANSNRNTFSYWIMLSSFFYLVSVERKHKSSSSSYIYLCVSLTHELGFISIWLPHE